MEIIQIYFEYRGSVAPRPLYGAQRSFYGRHNCLSEQIIQTTHCIIFVSELRPQNHRVHCTFDEWAENKIVYASLLPIYGLSCSKK